MNDPHRMLKKLLSITPDKYDIFYAPLYGNLQQWIESHAAALPTDTKQDHLKNIWQFGLDTLKIRRGYLLPVGSDAETCYREQAIWTYAVLTAALGKAVSVMFSQPIENIIETLIPSQGYGWLKNHSTLFDAWQTYLSGKSQDKTIFDVIEAQVQSGRAPPEDVTMGSENAAVSSASKAPLKITVTSFEEAAQNFIPWLKQNIADGTLCCNQKESHLYRVAEGIFLIMPEMLAHFQKAIQFDLPPTDKRSAVKKNLLRALSLQPEWIQTDRQQPWHTYAKEEENHVKTFRGFLLPVACLWGDNKQTWPMIETTLAPDIEA